MVRAFLRPVDVFCAVFLIHIISCKNLEATASKAAFILNSSPRHSMLIGICSLSLGLTRHPKWLLVTTALFTLASAFSSVSYNQIGVRLPRRYQGTLPQDFPSEVFSLFLMLTCTSVSFGLLCSGVLRGVVWLALKKFGASYFGPAIKLWHTRRRSYMYL